jgi:hypothetical protein
MATPRQIDVFLLHKAVCTANGHLQPNFLHRRLEGTVIPVPGTTNQRYTFPDPRTGDNPTDVGVPLWITWQPRRIMGSSADAGDNASGMFWQMRDVGQCAAIDNNYNNIVMQDGDFVTDPQGHRFRIENPILSPDNSFWSFEMAIMR